AARRSPLADLVRERLAELHRPLARRLVAHANAPLREHLLDHAKAQGKPEIEPNRVADHLRRKSMAAIEGITSGRHSPRLPRCPLQIRKADGTRAVLCLRQRKAPLFVAARPP